MTVLRYCTPEWLEECAKGYRANPKFKKAFEKLSTGVCFRAKADPAWGIDEDIIYGASVEKGELIEMGFYSEEAAKKMAEFIMAAPPQEWKSLLRNESKFVADFMVGKIDLEQGSKVGVLKIAPHSATFIEALTPTELQFPDEMSPEELNNYRAYVKEFRAKLGV